MLRELLAAGYRVRALVREAPAAPNVLPLPDDPNLERISGDLRAVGHFARALEGCRFVVHTGALYSFKPSDRAAMHAINVEGTESLLAAAHVAGVERAVLTSSSATLGHTFPGDAYHASKVAQERAAFAGRVPVVALLPTAPVGPGDWKPTPTGKLVLDFLQGKIAAKAPGSGGMNLVAVEDVARAHVAALQLGRAGERYALALAAAYADGVRCRIDPAATPFAPLEGVRMSRERMYADSSKAMRELGFVPTPVRAALERAVAWYREQGRSP